MPSLAHPRRPVQARHAGDHARVRGRVERPHGPPRRDGAPRRRLHLHRDVAPLRPVPRRGGALRLRRDRAPDRDRRGARALPRAVLADVRRRPRRSTCAPSCCASCRAWIAPTTLEAGARIVVAEQGLGPALVHYFVRSRVDGEVGVAEWPPASAFDDAPVRRWIFRVPELPERMRALLHDDAGDHDVRPGGPGRRGGGRLPPPGRAARVPGLRPGGARPAARAAGDEPWLVERMPPMGALSRRSRASRCGRRRRERRRDAARERAGRRARAACASSRRPAPWRERDRDVDRAARSCRSCGASRTRCRTRRSPGREIAMTDARGDSSARPSGIEAIPLGTFFVEVHPQLYMPAGHEVTPAVAPEVLARAIGRRRRRCSS